MTSISRLAVLWTGNINNVDVLLVNNILELDAEVLGCYSSTSLTLHSLIAQELVVRGGPSIRLEALKHGPARVGDVITLPGGKLKSTYVLAGVTNTLRALPTLQSLNRCVAAMLQRAASLNTHSLALPLLRVKGQLQPDDIVRATLTPIVDHISGTTSLRQIFIGVQGDDDPTYALNAKVSVNAIWSALAMLGARRSQLAGLGDIRARLALLNPSNEFLLSELQRAELELAHQVHTLLEHELRVQEHGRESLRYELEDCLQLIAELEQELTAAGGRERAVGE